MIILLCTFLACWGDDKTDSASDTGIVTENK
jgi:hypothetical protein